MFQRIWRSIAGAQPTTKLIDKAALETALERAKQCFQAGDTLQAEALVVEAAEQVRQQCGDQHVLYAAAMFNVACVLCGIDEFTRAAEACRTATAIPATDQASQKDRLTYWMNLGGMLIRTGQLDEAEQVLRTSLNERKAFYGVDHPGFAYGLAPLADLLIERCKYREALPVAEQAVSIDWKAGNDQVASDLVIRAYALAGAGESTPMFDEWKELPLKLQQNLLSACIDQSERRTPELSQRVLQSLRSTMLAHPPSDPLLLLNATILLANIARQTQDHAVRIEASRAIVDLATKRRDPKVVVEAWEGLAEAYDQAGQHDDVDQSFRQALEVAQQSQQPALAASVLRNYAIYADQQNRHQDAAQFHARAVELAEKSGDRVLLARCLGAYGIFSHHRGQLDAARPLLARAEKLIPPDDADAFYIINHLRALERGEPDPCGSHPELAMNELLERLVRDHLPAGLLKEIRVEDGGIKVQLAREPQPDEVVLLERVMRHARAQVSKAAERNCRP